MSPAVPSRSRTSILGNSSAKRASRLGTSSAPAGSKAPTDTRPRTSPRSSSTSPRIPSTSARIRRARAATAWPASVGVTLRLVRSKSSAPSSASSRRTCCDSADCATWSSPAARVKCLCLATASA